MHQIKAQVFQLFQIQGNPKDLYHVTGGLLSDNNAYLQLDPKNIFISISGFCSEFGEDFGLFIVKGLSYPCYKGFKKKSDPKEKFFFHAFNGTWSGVESVHIKVYRDANEYTSIEVKPLQKTAELVKKCFQPFKIEPGEHVYEITGWIDKSKIVPLDGTLYETYQQRKSDPNFYFYFHKIEKDLLSVLQDLKPELKVVTQLAHGINQYPKMNPTIAKEFKEVIHVNCNLNERLMRLMKICYQQNRAKITSLPSPPAEILTSRQFKTGGEEAHFEASIKIEYFNSKASFMVRCTPYHSRKDILRIACNKFGIEEKEHHFYTILVSLEGRKFAPPDGLFITYHLYSDNDSFKFILSKKGPEFM
eukprot:TRINITY_DN11743_c0_g1_i1.p1 TRINITY_DN11743_c0_g1~~TRINITY_DN11743_c0_g1_i1.p1  ORF type:complete len:423 (-),score=82.60 TRINITY_DN11743_c0_g1_i1:41-1123(-)